MTDPCPPFEAAMQLLSRRWAAEVIRAMLNGADTFGGIQRAAYGSTDRMVSMRLRELVDHDLVVRHELDSPTRVRYQLTPAGRALSVTVREIERWAHEYGHVLVPGGTLGE